MIKLESTAVEGFQVAIRGMRNPLNSWDKSDSTYSSRGINVGVNDLTLMKSLVKGGTDHRKFLRMITVSVDIIAPLYWWKEFDTYKVGTVRNSCSTMHTISKKEFDIDDFSTEHLMIQSKAMLQGVIDILNQNRELYNSTKDKEYWWQMIQLLPSSYNQRSTVLLNYEVLLNMYFSRKNHKLDEWVAFCKWVESLPLMRALIESVSCNNGE